MKPETFVSILLLGLFLLAAVFTGPVFTELTSMIGCFAIGWKIPDASKSIVEFYRRVTA